MTPTTEQTAILSAATSSSSNLMINALAGTGKSTTLRLIERVVSQRPMLYLAFNKRVVDAICYRSGAPDRLSSTTTVRTFNSLGHRIWAQAQGNLNLNAKKTGDILKSIIDDATKAEREAIWSIFHYITTSVAMAKAVGYVPEGKFPHARRLTDLPTFISLLDEEPDDFSLSLINTVLTRSITLAYAGTIDFNDQVYMPALFGGTYPKFPIVAVDEFQDLNPVNHEMLRRLVTKRVIGVGDRWQNIYGFRGATASGMADASTKFGMEPLTLSTSFRCPRVIVENARWRVPHFNWTKPGGYVETIPPGSVHSIPSDATVLCRNNAPLFRLAFHLLSSGVSVSVAGSDIGPKIVGILHRLGPATLSRTATFGAIDLWLASRLAKKSRTAEDMADCMRMFAGHGADLGQAISYAEFLFKQEGSIKLLTGHKAKGLEWPTVYILDPWLIRDDEQDLNLRYVMETRSMDKLFYIDSSQFKGTT